MDALLDNSVIVVIINAVLTLLGVFGIGILGFKKVIHAIAESADVALVFKNALADNIFTEEEVAAIRKEIDEAGGAWKDVMTRDVD